MKLQFGGELVEWRGPAPYVFLPIPVDESREIKEISKRVTYGWGCIAVSARVGSTDYTTSLFPRGDVYFLPIKVKVQKAENITIGSWVEAEIEI